MKKSIIAIAALSIASIIQAAQVDWTSGNMAEAVANARTMGVSGAGAVTAYYFVLENNEATRALFAQSQDGSLDQNAVYQQYKDQLSSADHTSTLNARNGTSWSQTLEPDKEEYVLTLYVAPTTSGGAYALAAVGHHSPSAAQEFEDYENEVTAGLATMAYANASGWTAVPEPTTVALLALGLAAVGLKRKVA